MAWLSTSATQTSCTMYVGGLMSFSTYTEIYISCNGQNSPNLIYGGSGYTTSKSWTIYRLSAGTDYFASYRIRTQAGNSDSSGQWFTTEYPPAPPSVGGVGYVSLSNSGEGSISVSWSWASNAEQYRVEVYNYYSGSYITGTQTTSTSTYIYGLPTGTYLEVKVYGMRSGSSNGTPSYNYITTTDYSVGGVGNVYVSAPALSGVLDVSWSYANNATGYRLEVYNYYTGAYIAGYQISGTSYRVTGLSENTYYQVKVYGQRNGNNGTPSYGYGWTYSFAPAQLTNLTAQAGTASGGVHMSWSSATNATGYRWEIYRGNTTNSAYYVTGANTTSTSASYIGLAEYTQYTIKVYATRSGYANGGYATAPVTTRDLTKPVVNITMSDGNGRMYILFNASDAHSGLRPFDTYYTEISNANGTVYGQGSYSTNNYRTFTVDANGNQFVHNAYYYMRVVAYDNAKSNDYNNNSDNVRIQFKLARPSSWAWHTSKVAGNPISLTAQEWNSFCIKINQFRQYRSLGNYSFSSATSGSKITASLMNQAVTAIREISPPTSPPSSVTANSTPITASFFNVLSSSLNSIQ